MCGIIGVTGADDALSLLIEGLSRLEYRGYDSAGVALVGRRRPVADAGPPKAPIRSGISDRPGPRGRRGPVAGSATPAGPPTASPPPAMPIPTSTAPDGLGLVHNGIIENHAELARGLVAEGHVLMSETDSEVLAHLVEVELAGGHPLAESLRRALRLVRGSFAVAAIHADEPEVVAAARRVSPLIVGVGEGASFLASDIPALLGLTRSLFALEDDQVAELRPGTVEVTDLDGERAQPTALTIGWDLAASRQGELRRLHDQGDPRAARCRGRYPGRPPSARTAPWSSTRPPA